MEMTGEVGLNGRNLYPCFRERAANCCSPVAPALMQVVTVLWFDSISPFLEVGKGNKL